MANSARRTVSYKPRYTDWEAYELLHPTLRRALQETVTEWSASWTLRYWKKNGLNATINALKTADVIYMGKGWIPAHGRRQKLASTFVTDRVKPLRTYRVL